MYGAHASACTPTTRTSVAARSPARGRSRWRARRRRAARPRASRRAPGARSRARSCPGPPPPRAGRRRGPRVKPSRLGEPLRLGLRLVVAAVHEAHLAAVLAHRGHLGQRRLRRHHEHGACARLARGEGHRLRVVARARRHHAARRARPRGSPRIMCVAPRALNEPVSWRFSAFSSTRAPTRRDSSPAEQHAASRAPGPASARAAPSTSASVTASSGATATPGGIMRRMATGRRPPACSPRTEVFGEARAARARGGRAGRRAAPLGPRRGDLPRGRRGRHLLPAPLGRRACSRASTRTGAWSRSPSCAPGDAVRRARDVPRRDAARPPPRRSSPPRAVALLAGDMQRLIRRNPDLALKLLASLAERVSRTNERLLQQSFQTVAGRVASALLAQTVTRQADGAPDADVLIRVDPGRDRAPGGHLARERQPLPRHARARRDGHPGTRQGDRA